MKIERFINGTILSTFQLLKFLPHFSSSFFSLLKRCTAPTNTNQFSVATKNFSRSEQYIYFHKSLSSFFFKWLFWGITIRTDYNQMICKVFIKYEITKKIITLFFLRQNTLKIWSGFLSRHCNIAECLAKDIPYFRTCICVGPCFIQAAHASTWLSFARYPAILQCLFLSLPHFSPTLARVYIDNFWLSHFAVFSLRFCVFSL